MIYNKTWISIDDQIQQLQNRGLEISDIEFARNTLSNISYYRLAGFWWPMQSDKANHTFKDSSTFENVIQIYNFDKALRELLFSAIESIEISFRTKLIYYLSKEKTPWWFEESSNFKSEIEHTKTIEAIEKELNRTKEVFIREHFRKYTKDTRKPPAWKTLEVASFGNISKLYGNLKPSIVSKDTIAKDFGAVNHTYLPSWVQSITQIRNLCAHHSRIWNKNLPGSPKLLSKPPNKWINDVPDKSTFHFLYIHLCIIKYMLDVALPNNTLSNDLQRLLLKYPNIDPKALGLKSNWQTEPLWQT